MSKITGRNVYFLLLLQTALGFANAQSNFKTTVNYKADRLSISDSISSPRSVIRDESGDILVVSEGSSHVLSVYQDDDKIIKSGVIIDGTGLGLNHGLAYNNGYLYASTTSQVLRWIYSPGQRTKVTVTPEIVVKGIPAGGEHVTRSLIVDRFNNLYVSVGSAANVEETETRAQIRRFNLAEGFPHGGYDYQNGEKFATGVRNAVGLAIDNSNYLWGVDCGADQLIRDDLGGDIHNSNPADELIRFDASGSNYGYPYCWTVDELFGHVKGEQLAWPDFMNDSVHTDAWCRSFNNNRPPTLSLPAHNAPLGLIFYDGVGCDSYADSFPCSMKGDLFIAFHGSWNREPPSGYKVVRVPVNPNTQLPTGEIEDIIFEADPSKCLHDSNKCFRPVDLVFSQNGHLIISSDDSNELIRVAHKVTYREVIVIIKKSLHVPGLVALGIIVLISACLIIMTARRFCCRRSDNVPYMMAKI